MKSKLVACGMVASAFALAFFGVLGEASAKDSIGNDEVLLKSGGSLRGTVVTVEPGSKVVFLVSGEKEPRNLPWAEVSDVEKGKYGGDDEAEEERDTKAEEDEPAPEASSGQGRVRLTIESEEPVQLIEEVASSYGVVGGYGIYAVQTRVACASPCNKVVDGSRGQRFVIAGDGVTASETFVLNDRNEDTTIKVDPGSAGLRTGGVWLTVIGASVTVAGGVGMPIAYALNDGTGSLDGFMIASGVTLGVGIAMLGAGIPMIVAGGTDIEVKPTQAALSWSDDGSTYRPRAVAPSYWLGQF